MLKMKIIPYSKFIIHHSKFMLCHHCQQDFALTELDQKFLTKLQVPEPTICPDCRRKQRLAFWPFGILQKRKCDFSGEDIISTFPANARFPVYHRDHWFSDQWQAPEQEIDWQRPFLEQLYELQCQTPHFHRLSKNAENSEYADDVWDTKNAYMSRSMADCEDVSYIYRTIGSKNCLDQTYCFDMTQSYECTYCFQGYNLKFSLNSRNCTDSYFLYDCRGCTNCFMCWNLRNKQYHIRNKAYSKEEYEKMINTFKLNSRASLAKFKEEFEQHLREDAYHQIGFNNKIENSSGNYLDSCKNCQNCYFLEKAEDCLNVMRGLEDKDCYDTSGLLRGELCYGICQCTDLHKVNFAYYSVDCSEGYYIDQCFNSKHLFGCVGLKRKEYCILNKQYTNAEYEELVSKLIEHMKKNGEWGKFFPYKFAYNGFNLSLAAFYYTETPESITKLGGFWEEPPTSEVQGQAAKTLPDLAEDISEKFINQVYNCAKTGRPYKFVKHELEFYRKHKLPLPIYYPEERNRERFAHMVPLNPRQLNCTCCKQETTTYYPEDWGYKNILCEKCYLEKVY
ncbi:MAG: hypothetical protein PHU71_01980 [Candidatus Gracilibacteria bacterium]|nr:hypothetical protein [Candidatus Gracilibacteria bacterium]